jgi:hypothetical protein
MKYSSEQEATKTNKLPLKSLMDIENFFISLLHSKYVYEVI